VQSKITKAADYIDTAADYVDSGEMNEESDRKGKGSGTKDACYYKVKSRYSVWPSAYASGALVKCRKVGAANWGNKSEAYVLSNWRDDFFPTDIESVNIIEPEPLKPSGSKGEQLDEILGGLIQNIRTNLKKTGEIPVKQKPSGGGNPLLNYAKQSNISGAGDPFARAVDKMQNSYQPEGEQLSENPLAVGAALGIAAGGAAIINKLRQQKTSGEQGNPQPGIVGNMQKRNQMLQQLQNQSYEPEGEVLDEKCWPGYKKKGMKTMFGKRYPNCVKKEGFSNWRSELQISELLEDWQEKNRKDGVDGLSQSTVDAYRRENPGSKLQTAVTEKKPTGKRADRRKSFCRRMKGMKAKLTSAKTARDPDSRINKALRRWNCN